MRKKEYKHMRNAENWCGPYEYRKITMKVKVEQDRRGNYMLGYINKSGEFIPQYVGRSDNDLQSRLIQHITEGDIYEVFIFKYARTLKAAYETECISYHEFEEQIDNVRHPDRPDYYDYICPICKK